MTRGERNEIKERIDCYASPSAAAFSIETLSVSALNCGPPGHTQAFALVSELYNHTHKVQ